LDFIFPPIDLLKDYAQLYGIPNIHILQWFTKDQCNLTKLNEMIPFIYPYYNPCKGTFLTKDLLTYENSFKVFRHLLKAHNFNLSYKEKSRGGKQMWYKIESDSDLTRESTTHHISFE
jgi:hypothetical protein